ncbi:hypothetical protein CEXT_268361 [Caerostris extrusa]|uniref:Uncharacterized protein n=1 Tax=Caerostris extrusa TaxID=172846 RepID=A0AAV4UZP4_CAEEX|nr:hypothetical protein CEXT_268361 [Caerostris extrusa]
MLSNLQDRRLRILREQGTSLTTKPRDIRTDKPIATTVPLLGTHDLLLHRTSWSIHPAQKYFETSVWKVFTSKNTGMKQKFNSNAKSVS